MKVITKALVVGATHVDFEVRVFDGDIPKDASTIVYNRNIPIATFDLLAAVDTTTPGSVVTTEEDIL